MYPLLRLFTLPRSLSADSTVPNAPPWHGGCNSSRARPRTDSYGDVHGGHSPSRWYAPYPSRKFAPNRVPMSPDSQHALKHGNPFSNGSTSSYPTTQVEQHQPGWHPMPPSASSRPLGTYLGHTDGIHNPGSVTASFTPNVAAHRDPGNLAIAEEWGRQSAWNPSGELGTSAFFLLRFFSP